MWAEFLAIAGGFVLLAWSADRFVAGASALALNMKIAPLIIGLTIVSFGTSAPEVLISGVASWQGNPGLAIGNALGSNIINTGLILGITALIMPLTVHSGLLRRELPLLVIVMLAVLVLLLDQTLGRFDGLLLLGGMGVMLLLVIRLGRQAEQRGDPMGEEYADEIPADVSMQQAVFQLITGALILLLSSRLLVWGSVSVARELGISDLLIGLTIVALGTSLPELAASVMSAVKNEHDIAIGNIIGSNMFNMLAVLGLPGLLAPGAIDPVILTRDFPVLFGLTVALFIMAYGFRGPGRINRLEGMVLVIAFSGYQTLLYFSEAV